MRWSRRKWAERTFQWWSRLANTARGSGNSLNHVSCLRLGNTSSSRDWRWLRDTYTWSCLSETSHFRWIKLRMGRSGKVWKYIEDWKTGNVWITALNSMDSNSLTRTMMKEVRGTMCLFFIGPRDACNPSVQFDVVYISLVCL